MQAETYEVKLDDFFKTTIEKMELLGATRLNKGRTDFIQRFVNALIVSRSVQFSEVASKMTGLATEESKHRQIQRFIGDYDLDYEWVSLFILLLLPQKGKKKLVMDRTNWSFGSHKHNILVVSVYSHGIGIPIWFEVLDSNGGNSSCEDRMYVLLKCIEILGKDQIHSIIADSEFIGTEWIKFLVEEKILFFIDVRSNQYVIHQGKQKKITHWLGQKKKLILNSIKIFDQYLGIAIKKQPTDKRKAILAIVTNALAKDALNQYRCRWSIETLFNKLKKNGFRLEDTHLTEPARLRKLFALVSIGFTLCFLVGLAEHHRKNIVVKNHGYKTVSFFRNGLNFIRKALKNSPKIDNNGVFEFILSIVNSNFDYRIKIVM
jgi:hypothetical protein